MVAVTGFGCGSHSSSSEEPVSTRTRQGPVSAPVLSASTDPIKQTTATTETVKFIAVGDTGKGKDGQKTVARNMAEWCTAHGCDFILLLGDNFYQSGVTSVSDPLWAKLFEEPYKDIQLPFYAILGNHDYGGNGLGNEFEKASYQILYTEKSSKWKMPAAVYRIEAGPVEIVVLDTNSILYNRKDGQQERVAEWVNKPSKGWRLAAGHHPYLSNGPHGNAGSYDGFTANERASGQNLKTFMDNLICGKTDLYLAGHDHSRQWLTPTCNGTELAVSGAGSAPTGLAPNNLARFASGTLGFMYIEATAKKLDAKFVNEKGAVDFSRSLSKE